MFNINIYIYMYGYVYVIYIYIHSNRYVHVSDCQLCLSGVKLHTLCFFKPMFLPRKRPFNHPPAQCDLGCLSLV